MGRLNIGMILHGYTLYCAPMNWTQPLNTHHGIAELNGKCYLVLFSARFASLLPEVVAKGGTGHCVSVMEVSQSSMIL